VTAATFALEIVLPAVVVLAIWALAAAALVVARRRASGPLGRGPRQAPRLRVLAGGASAPVRESGTPGQRAPQRAADAAPLRVIHRA
jgi:hypothetical protein